MTITHAVVKHGVVIKQGNFIECWDVAEAECKLLKQKMRWGDYGVMMKRRMDPKYVCFRNKSRKREIAVVTLRFAPENYLEEICKIYKWNGINGST